MTAAYAAVETSRESAGPHDGVPAGSGGHRVTCIYHCATCERHFASLEAFDLHTPGRCQAPESVVGETPRHRLVEKSTDGICAIGSAEEVHGVTVWQTEAARDSGTRPA